VICGRGRRGRLEPDQELAVAERADQGTALGPRAGGGQRGLTAGSEQPPGRLGQHRISGSRDVDRDLRAGDPRRANALGEGGRQEARCQQFVPQGGIGQHGAHPQRRARRLA
jgi:hypothetical protein